MQNVSCKWTKKDFPTLWNDIYGMPVNIRYLVGKWLAIFFVTFGEVER